MFKYIYLCTSIGLVAQLNSAPDYGSGGYRFESCRGHKQKSFPFGRLFLFSILEMDEYLVWPEHQGCESTDRSEVILSRSRLAKAFLDREAFLSLGILYFCNQTIHKCPNLFFFPHISLAYLYSFPFSLPLKKVRLPIMKRLIIILWFTNDH